MTFANAQVATKNAAKITPGPTKLTAPRPARLPQNRLNTKPSAGKSRISASAGKSTVIASSPASPLEQRQFVGVQRVATAEHRDDDREPDGGLGRGNRHHEEHDHLAVHRSQPARQRDES